MQFANEYFKTIKSAVDFTKQNKMNLVAVKSREELYPEDNKRLSTRQQIAKLPNVKLFMPKCQQTILMKQNSEELDGVLKDLEKQLAAIPRKAQDKSGKEQIVHAHYFYGSSDWFILDYDKSRNAFFSFGILNGDDQMAEFVYTSVDEITENGKVELDFYWRTKPLQEASKLESRITVKRGGSNICTESIITQPSKLVAVT